MLRFSFSRAVPVAIACATLLVCGPASAATIGAYPGGDGTTADGHCSLREAINAANNDNTAGGECVAGAGADTIALATATYDVDPGAANEDGNASGDFDITDDLTIMSPDAALTTINGHSRDRVLDIASGVTVTISGVTIREGAAPAGTTGSPGTAGSRGGGIRALGPLTLDHVVVTENHAGSGGNGSIGDPGGNAGQGGDGGGIYSLSFVSVTDSVVSENVAGNGGDGGHPAVSCSSAAVGGHGGFGGSGGAILADNGGAVITRSTIRANSSGSAGPGGCANTPGNGNVGGEGGGIAGSTIVLTDSTVSDNAAGGGSSAGSDANGANSAVTGRGGEGGGIYAYAIVTISGSTITGNFTGAGGSGALGTGAGVATAPGGTGGTGGGLLVGAGGTFTNTTIANNHTGGGGVSQRNLAGAGGGGGGLAFRTTVGGALTLNATTINGNTTGGGGGSSQAPVGGGAGGAGGGLLVGGTMMSAVTAAISNATITGNSTGAGGNNGGSGAGGSSGTGGGIAVGENATVELTHETVAANQTGNAGSGTIPGTRADGGGIGIYAPAAGSTAASKNTILASNEPGNCEVLAGTLTDGGHNVIFGAQCTGLLAGVTTDPLLGALADNGGPTQTMALAEGSSALDIVPSAGSGCSSADQRGTSRPQGSACDAGAFELFRAPPSAGGGTPPGSQPTDKTPPLVKLFLTRQRLQRALRRGYAAGFSSNELGSAVLELFVESRVLRSRRVRVARRTLTVTKTGRNRLVAAFTRKARKRLARRRAVRLRLVLTAKDRTGNATKKTARVQLRR